MSFVVSYADALAKYVEELLGTSDPSGARQDVKAWVNRVVEVTWINQPQNVYNLIALACALIFVSMGVNYAQKHL